MSDRHTPARLSREPGRAAHGAQLSLPLTAVCCLLSAVLVGCESLQRKLTRKPKTPAPPPTPIITFQDYTQAMTPLDRYRKHYLIFDYWNSELMDALKERAPNPKRLTRTSTEALGELGALKDLLREDAAARLGQLIEERSKMQEQLQSPALNISQAAILSRALEAQSRMVHRDFFWRDVQDQLKP